MISIGLRLGEQDGQTLCFSTEVIIIIELFFIETNLPGVVSIDNLQFSYPENTTQISLSA
jgi:hypothetical protein